MIQSLNELKERCSKLGLTVTKSGRREAKADYVFALRAHYLFHDYPNGPPFDELCPMLCFPYGDLRPDQQESVWKDDNQWVAQQKMNGCRVILHFIKGVGAFAQSRVVSLKTYRRTEVTDQLLFGDFVPGFTATVDTEAIIDKQIDTRSYTDKGAVTRSSLQSTAAVLHMSAEASKRLQQAQDAPLIFHTFDITNWNGADLRSRKLCERLGILLDFRAALMLTEIDRYFQFPSVCFAGKKGFYDQIIAAGGEGCILKNLNSTYEDSNSRRRNSWVKVKRDREFDAFVSGFELGRAGTKWERQIACLVFSVRTESGDQPIAKIVNIPKTFRRKISVANSETKKVELHPDMYGKTAHIRGAEVSQRAYRLVHPKIVRWYRLGVENPCTYPLSAIKG